MAARRRPHHLRPLEIHGLTTPHAAAAAGIVFAVLFTTSILLGRYAVATAPTGPAKDSWLWHGVSIMASYLVPLTGVAFLWFIGVVRDRIGIREDKFFATVFLGSGVVFVTILFTAAAVLAAELALAHPTTAASALGLSIARSLFYLYGARSAAVFTLVTSTIVLRTGAVPTWAALTGFVFGLVLLLGTQWLQLMVLLFPVWVALLSVLILVSALSGEAAQDRGARKRFGEVLEDSGKPPGGLLGDDREG